MPDVFPQWVIDCAFDLDAGPAFKQSVMAGFPAYYSRLRGDGSDISGNALAVTANNMVWTMGISPLPGDPASNIGVFNGSSADIAIAASSIIDAIVGAWTVEAWVYPTGARVAGGMCGVVSREFVSSSIPFCLAYGNPVDQGGSSVDSCATAAFYTGSAWKMTTDGVALPLNTWTHLAGTWDGTTLRLYKNGALVSSSVPGVANVASSGHGTFVGRRWDTAGTSPYFPGYITDAAVHPICLSADAIAYIYESRNVVVSPTWTDVTTKTKSITWTRGKQYELDKIQAASGQWMIDNTDRSFEPGYTASPYYPNVLPMRQIRVRGLFNSVYYSRARLYAERFPEAWPNGPTATETAVDLTDAFEPLNNNEGVSFTAPSESTGARIARVHQAIGVDPATASVMAGEGTVGALTLAQTNALTHIQECETTEDGLYYVAVDGTRTFLDRNTVGLAGVAPSYAFGDADDGTELRYKDLTPDFDKERIYNDVQVTPAGASVPQIARDAASRRQYDWRTLAISSLDTDTSRALSYAQYLLNQYVQPLQRIQQMTLVVGPGSDTNLIQAMLELEIGMHVSVTRRPQGAGFQAISQVCTIEQIQETITPESWTQVIQLAPADTTIYWHLGTTGQSELGSTTRLGF